MPNRRFVAGRTRVVATVSDAFHSSSGNLLDGAGIERPDTPNNTAKVAAMKHFLPLFLALVPFAAVVGATVVVP